MLKLFLFLSIINQVFGDESTCKPATSPISQRYILVGFVHQKLREIGKIRVNNFEFQIPISLILINDWLKMILEIIFARNLAKSAYKYAYFFQSAFLCSRRSQCRNYCIYILLCPWINERKHILERCQKWGKKYQLVIIIMLIIQASSKLACNTQTRHKTVYLLA